jgi:hypothetical protein
MQTMKMVLLVSFCFLSRISFSQTLPDDINTALNADDTTKLAGFVTTSNINTCYQQDDWQYSLLAQSIRHHAKNCFDWLIQHGADVNKACNGYVPPLMHAAKYGPLEMVKTLVAKGADINYKYEGAYTPANGETPASYAEKNHQTAIADYLRSVKSKP